MSYTGRLKSLNIFVASDKAGYEINAPQICNYGLANDKFVCFYAQIKAEN